MVNFNSYVKLPEGTSIIPISKFSRLALHSALEIIDAALIDRLISENREKVR